MTNTKHFSFSVPFLSRTWRDHNNIVDSGCTSNIAQSKAAATINDATSLI